MQDFQNTFILVNKPVLVSSFQVVGYFRKKYNLKKIGHCGTLDPLASGLLILATGTNTKLIQAIQDSAKTYFVTAVFGYMTDSYDRDQPINYVGDASFLSLETLNKISAEFFCGKIVQIPPVFSAINVAGNRAYKLAREGKVVDLEPKQRQVFEYNWTKLQNIDDKIFAEATIVCSKGTYIRSLIHDLGQHLGCGAFVWQLARTKIGDHSLSDAIILAIEPSSKFQIYNQFPPNNPKL